MSKLAQNYLPEFLAFISGRPKPSMVTVNLTERCNQHCIYCEIGQGIPSAVTDALTLTDMKWLLSEMSSHRIPRLSLCGGEPFLFGPIRDVITFATTKNIRCSITSNGMTIYRLAGEDFKALRENRADINLSIDSFSEEINAFTRGTPSALGNALLSIQKLKAEHIPFTVLSAISRYNYRDLYEFIVEAHRIGIRQVLFQPIIHYTNYPDRQTIQDKSSLNVPIDQVDVLVENLREIMRFEKKHPINTNVYRILPWIKAYLLAAAGQDGHWFFEDVLQKFYCREVYATVDIAYDGGIQPCGLTRASVNIRDRQERGLPELWEEATKGIKRDISQGNYYPYCNACCHKFSRNMMASIIKYPWTNKKAMSRVMPLVFSRMVSRTKKKLSTVNK